MRKTAEVKWHFCHILPRDKLSSWLSPVNIDLDHVCGGVSQVLLSAPTFPIVHSMAGSPCAPLTLRGHISPPLILGRMWISFYMSASCATIPSSFPCLQLGDLQKSFWGLSFNVCLIFFFLDLNIPRFLTPYPYAFYIKAVFYELTLSFFLRMPLFWDVLGESIWVPVLAGKTSFLTLS